MTALGHDEILALVQDELCEVLGSDERPAADARFEEDLGADSLDLVETVERVEAALRRRGVHVTVAEERIRALVRVGDAVAAIREAAER